MESGVSIRDLISCLMHVKFVPHSAHCYTSQCSSGGVVLASRDGKIVCENTLDARLQVVFRKKLPEVSNTLFPLTL